MGGSESGGDCGGDSWVSGGGSGGWTECDHERLGSYWLPLGGAELLRSVGVEQ